MNLCDTYTCNTVAKHTDTGRVMAGCVTVTTFAPRGVTPTTEPGRWVVVGGHTLWSYFRVMYVLPKLFQRVLGHSPMDPYPFDNYLALEVSENRLCCPGDGLWDKCKYHILGHRVYGKR